MIQKFFNTSAGVALLITGIAKIASFSGAATILRRLDPILHVEFSHLMLFAGIIELLVAIVCFRFRNTIFATALIAWLSTGLLIYRLGLWWVGYQRPCNCLGTLTDALHIQGATADMAMKYILAYLIFGSFACMYYRWRNK